MTTIESDIINSVINKTEYCNINTSYRIYKQNADNLGQLRVNGSLIAVVYYINDTVRNVVITVKKITPLIASRLTTVNKLVGVKK